jgi:hypothetical protein
MGWIGAVRGERRDSGVGGSGCIREKGTRTEKRRRRTEKIENTFCLCLRLLIRLHKRKKERAFT